VNGGDLLVQIDMPRGVAFDKTRAESNGRDITGVFRAKPNAPVNRTPEAARAILTR
jgi:hypothetical protein